MLSLEWCTGFCGLALIGGLLWAANSGAQSLEREEDHGLSPYFFVHSDDPEVDRLPLRSTSVETRIAGVIADVRVTQVYENAGRRPLEAVYVFPASTRSAVHGLKMTIGERTIIAQVREREQARREYEQARDQGRSASLLEQQRPNVFQMNVANIMPGDAIRVELRYTELLVPVDGVYEFVYPTVVGPRYAGEKTDEADPWIANPYLREGEAPSYTFAMQVELNAGMPIQDVACPSHPVQVDYREEGRAVIALDREEADGGNRDFILRYRLAGRQIHSGLLLHEGAEENFFLLMVQPPARIAPEQIPPREFIFVVDVSGSMHGFPLDTAKRLLRDLLGGLRPVDRFNVLLFAGGSELLAERSLPATRNHVERALRTIDEQRGGGGTELLPALERALALPRDEETARTVLVITDGYVRVEQEAFDLIRGRLGEANLFAFGIGSSVNRLLIEGMARAGMGEPFVVASGEQAEVQSDRFRRYVSTPVLTRVELDFDGFEVYDVEPARVPDVLAERPVIAFGKWRGPARGTIRLRGRSGDGEHRAAIDVAGRPSAAANEALRYLWARHRIARLGDYVQVGADDGRREEITRLGLEYNLLTAYTSHVAIDTEVRRDGSPVTTVRQPLPLPQGVSDLAVGGGMALRSQAPAPAKMHRESAFYTGAIGGDQAGPAVEVEEAEPADEDDAGLKVVTIEVSPGLDREAMRRALVVRLRPLLAELRSLRLEVRFTVDARGRAGQVEVRGADLDEELEERLRQLLTGKPFARPAGGTTVRVRFVFSVP